MEKVTITVPKEKQQKQQHQQGPNKKIRKNKPVNNLGRVRGDLGRRLASESDYLKTIMDPLNVIGVQVPDEVTLPSVSTQCIQRLQVTTTSDGVAGCSFLVGSLQGNGAVTSTADIATTNSRLTALEALDKPKYAGTTSDKGKSPLIPKLKTLKLPVVGKGSKRPSPVAAVGDYDWGAWNGSDGYKTYAADLKGISVQGRVVSAGIYAFYEGTPLSMQGRGIIVSASRIEAHNDAQDADIPQPTLGQTYDPPANASDALFQRMVTDKPLQACRGEMSGRFIPQDEGDRVYFPTSAASTTAYQQGRLTAIYEGMAAGQNVEFWVVENWEFLPLTTSVNLVQPRPSLHDPIDMALTANVLSQSPYAAVAPSRVTQGQRDGKITEHKNGPVMTGRQDGRAIPGVMGTLLNFIEEAIPVGQEIFKKVGPVIGPLLTTLL